MRDFLKDNPDTLRHIPEIWERTWFLELDDDGKTPFRKHGGVI